MVSLGTESLMLVRVCIHTVTHTFKRIKVCVVVKQYLRIALTMSVVYSVINVARSLN